jgi:uncharacterized Zn finger protein (UPF0148 family)
MEKYGVVLDDEKSKTAGSSKTCPKCGRALDTIEGQPWCPVDGTEPFEKRPTSPQVPNK